METEWEGRVAGIFEADAEGRVCELSDGLRWRHEGNIREYIDRKSPKAKLIWDQWAGTRFLDVEETSGVVIVVPERGMGGLSAGAY